MQDGIINGTGNSRYLKTISGFLSLYPTYEAFAQAVIAGTLPVDLNGKNPDGWAQQGTPLNKANLLTPWWAWERRRTRTRCSLPSQTASPTGPRS